MMRSRAIQASLTVAAVVLSVFSCQSQAPAAAVAHPNPITPVQLAQMAAVTRVIVPDVRGRTPEDAQAILSKAGLSPRNTARSAGPGAVGTVWQQTPTQGSTVIRDTPADITVVAAPLGTSDGDGEFRTRVPSLVGENVLQALRDINRSHLQAGSVTRQPGNGTTGAVTTQNPLAGQWVSVLSKVDITVNVPEKKPPSDKNSWKIVPPLSGQTQKAAAQILAETGLRLGQVTPGNAQSPSGTIYGQEPSPGSKVRAGTSVNVWVAQKSVSAAVIVPDLTHTTPGSAKTMLGQRHLQLGMVEKEESDNFVGLIVSQSPAPNTRVDPKSAVNVTLAVPRTLVAVPNLLHQDEPAAIAALEQAGLRMGNVNQQDSDEDSGTIVGQNPPAQAKVRTETPVNVTVSNQITRELTVMADDPNPEIGKPVKFHAHLEPETGQIRYQFRFDGGNWSKWQNTSVITHRYRTAGNHTVEAVAMVGGRTIPSSSVPITAREAILSVSITTSSTTPKPDEQVVFTAFTDRTDIHPAYQFVFADGTVSKWSANPVAPHSYHHRGRYPVMVRAQVEMGKITDSRPREIYVGLLPVLWAAVGTVMFASSLGGFRLHGRSQFRRLIRAQVQMDDGQQHLDLDSHGAKGESVRVRMVRPPGETRVTLAPPQEPRKRGKV